MPDPQISARSLSRNDWLVVVACMASLFMQAVVSNVYPVFSGTLAQELNLSASEIGLLVSIYSIAYALTQIPAGLLAARYSRYKILVSSTIIMGLGCLLFAAVPQYGTIMVARIVLGIGAGLTIPTVTYLLSDLMSGPKLDRAMGFFGSGWGAGTIFTFFGLSLVVSSSGWRATMVVAAIVAAVLTVFIALSLRGRVPAVKRNPWASILPQGSLKLLVLNRPLYYLIFINLTALSTMLGVITFAPSFFQSNLSSGPVVANLMTGILGVMWLLSSLLGGAVAARLGRPLVIYSSMAACFIVPLLFPFFKNEISAVILIVLLGWFTMFYFGPVLAMIPRFVPPQMTSIGTGYFNALGWTGPFVTPLLFGLALDNTGAYLYGFATVSLISLVGVGSAYALRRELAVDHATLAPTAPHVTGAE